MFVLGYRPQGARQFRRITLGVYGPLTTEQAREQALRQLSDATKGVDPLAARRLVWGGLTVREMGASYLAEVGRRRKPATATEYNRLWKKNVLRAVGTAKPVAGVSTADIRRLHRSLHETPYLANRLVAMLGGFFSYAIAEEAIPSKENPAHGIELYPEKSRERFLNEGGVRAYSVRP